MKELVICAKQSVNLEGGWPIGYEDEVVPGSDVWLTLVKIVYLRKMFSPCMVTLHFSASVLRPDVLKNVFLSEECKVRLYDYDIVNKKTVWLAENYYVGGIAVSTSGKDSVEYVLKCYSYDRHLTEKKGCQAFTAKKFGSEIFKTSVEDNGMAGMCECETNRLLMMGYNSANCYRDGKHNETENNQTVAKPGHDTELIHPYLVRYNESLYDFLARVSHRCGEFLYFEDGKLNLGLPERTIKHLTAPEDSDKPPIVSPLCSYTGVNAGYDDDTDAWSSDYVCGTGERNDSSPCYDAEYASDEYLYHVSESDSLKSTGGWWIAYRALGTLFTSDNIVDGMVNAGLCGGMHWIYSDSLIPSQAKTYLKKNHIDRDNDVSSELINPKDGTAYNLCNRFYHIIDTLEEKALHRMVKMDFSSTYPNLSLGDDVKLDAGVEDWCLITCLSGSYSYVGTAYSESHSAEGVPVIKSAGIDRIDCLKNIAVPAARIVSHRVESSPREAVVVQNDDPLRLNRVKVRYPWQKDDSDATPWIRVAVPFAGSRDTFGGFTMTPEVGEHVVVDYYDGNIERPYVDGSFYFKSHTPSLGYTPDVPRILQTMDTHEVPRAIVSGNGHSISFLDMPDTGWMSTALPLFGTFVNLIKIPEFSEDSHRFKDTLWSKIKGGSIMMKDGTGICSVTVSPDEKAITVKSDFGTVNMSAFSGIDIAAPNGDVSIIGKNVSIEAGNNLTLEAGTNIQRTKSNWKDVLALQSGTVIGKAVTEFTQVSTGIDLSKTFDLSFVRSVMDMVLRPVEGKLTIHSCRNVIMTAGDGKVSMPTGYLTGLGEKVKKHYKHSELGFLSSRPIVDAMDMACAVIDDYYKDVTFAAKNIHKLASQIKTDANNAEKRQIFESNIDHQYLDLCDSVYKLWKAAQKGDTLPDVNDVRINQNVNNNDNEFLVYDVAEIFWTGVKRNYAELCDSWARCEELLRSGKLQNRLTETLRPIDFEVKVDKFPYLNPADDYTAQFGSDCNGVMDLMKLMYVERNIDNAQENLLNVPEGVELIGGAAAINDNDIGAQILLGFKNYINDRKKVMKRSAIIQLLLQSKYLRMRWKSVPGNLDIVKLVPVDSGEGEDKSKNITGIRGLENYVLQNDLDNYPWSAVLDSLFDLREIETTSKNEFGHAMAKGVFSVLGGGGDYSFETNKWKALPNVQKLLNSDGAAGPRAWAGLVCDVGYILFSKSKDKTMKTGEKADGWKAYSNNEVEEVKDKINKLLPNPENPVQNNGQRQ